MEQWLADEPTLLWLMEQECSHEQDDTSSWGRLAAAGHNLLMMTGRLGSWKKLTQHGLNDAMALGDRQSQANCLQSLGDLALRESALEQARTSYEQALPLFREIHSRLGEANCL
ncbi:MAG: hypothetical protein HQL73_13305, partial [Magnetococcales bacterium]|nr:hypothetical protein [Magnetococcales bacterium]